MKAFIQLIFTVVYLIFNLSKPGGTKALVAENLLLRQQLIVLAKKRQRSPNLKNWDRLVFGLCTQLIKLPRLHKISILLKPATILKIHKVFVKRKYRKLFSNKATKHLKNRGPNQEIINLVLQYKKRNPAFGYLRIAMQINNQFGFDIDKDVVRRILNKHYKGGPDDYTGPSWLTFLSHTKDSLWSVDLFRVESINLVSYWVMLIMDQYTRRIIGFSIKQGNVSGVDVCCMFNSIISGRKLPKRISSDNDPLFRFHRWQANLRILNVEEIKTVPYTPISHPFVERLIGTIRQEYLNKTLFWSSCDLQKKLDLYREYYNNSRSHSANDSMTPSEKSGIVNAVIDVKSFKWEKHLKGLFQLPTAA